MKHGFVMVWKVSCQFHIEFGTFRISIGNVPSTYMHFRFSPRSRNFEPSFKDHVPATVAAPDLHLEYIHVRPFRARHHSCSIPEVRDVPDGYDSQGSGRPLR